MIDRFERFSFAITEIYRYLNKISAEEMKKYDLKGACAFYLVAIYYHSEGVTSSQLCELCNRNKADVSRTVSKLEEKELVTRASESNNQYRALIKLTDKGKAAAMQISKKAALAVELGGKGLSEDERTIFYDSLELIAKNLQALAQDGLPI